MKQIPRKLVLRSEVLRNLEILDTQALKGVTGGNADKVQVQGESGRVCTAAPFAASMPGE
jgi:hypothetical protein